MLGSPSYQRSILMANLFTHYSQEENRFTNGLLSLLELSYSSDQQLFVDFFSDVLAMRVCNKNSIFKVLQKITGTADGEISNDKMCLLFEVKIRSGTLRKDQICSHLMQLVKKTQKLRKLILLTPDDSASSYIEQTRRLSKDIIHLEWKRVYSFLEAYAQKHRSPLSSVISQYLKVIRDRIFTQDIAAVIVKIDFSERSGVASTSYLREMEQGEWDDWRTPRKYKHLDGRGRKLILYDKTQKALTVEVEIAKVKKTRIERDYPWSNKFASRTLKIYYHPIPVEDIRRVDRLEHFGIHRKDRSAYRNITQEQYRALMGQNESA